jgi:hypothetical protein
LASNPSLAGTSTQGSTMPLTIRRLQQLRASAAFALLLIVGGCGPGGPAGATLDYWNRLIESSGMRSVAAGDQRTQAVADLRLRADAIERLPTSGVDLDASRIGLTGARLLREQAMLAEQGGYLPAAAFADGFVWGLTGEGNPFGSTMQYGDSMNSWGGRYQAWCDDAQRVRVQLTSKYGTEFPNLIRSAPPAGYGSPTSPVAAKPSWWSRQSWTYKLFLVGVGIYLLIQFFNKQSKGTGNAK